MFFRRGIRDDAWLPAKIALFSVGALIAVVGMLLQSDWVIGIAGLVLAAGILIRFVPRPDGDERDEPGDEPDPPPQRPDG